MKTTKLLCLFSFLVFGFNPALGQFIQVGANTLSFGVLSENRIDSLPILLRNPTDRLAQFRLKFPLRIYGSQPYSVSDTSGSIPAGGQKTIWVRCSISHNTAQPGALIIQTFWPLPGGLLPVGETQVRLQAQGRYSKTYYSGTENKAEEELKSILKNRLAQNYNGFSYDVARDKMYGSIDNKNDSVTCVYTGRKARFNTRNGATSNNFNCEHTFPQGFFGQDLPMRSDIHHLFSTDDAANNSRGNLPFGKATPPYIQPSINAPSLNGGGFYEPQDSHKGNCARAMMYFVLRYQDYTNFYAPQDSILRAWHRQFLPKPNDTLRNTMIFAQQNNRNPFVDYPQLEARIRNLVGPSVADSFPVLGMNYASIGPNFGYALLTPADTVSLVAWNAGNKPLQIQNLRLLSNPTQLIGGNGQNIFLSRNSAVSFRLVWGNYSDTLAFETNDPQRPQVRIPVAFGTTAVTENKVIAKPTLSPNPVSNHFNLNFQGNQPSWIAGIVRDVFGREVYRFHQQEPGKNGQFQVPAFPPGSYSLELKQPDATHIIRFVRL